MNTSPFSLLTMSDLYTTSKPNKSKSKRRSKKWYGQKRKTINKYRINPAYPKHSPEHNVSPPQSSSPPAHSPYHSSKSISPIPPRCGRGRGQPRGYGYIGSISASDAHLNRAKSHQNDYGSHRTVTQTYTMAPNVDDTVSTQSKYKRMPTLDYIKGDNPSPNDVRIEANGTMREYVDYVSKLLKSEEENQCDKIRLLAHSRNITKMVQCVELIKREINGLHQLTELKNVQLCAVYEPLEKGLRTVTVETEIAQVSITLSFKSVFDKADIGYQKPITFVDICDVKCVLTEVKNEKRELQRKLNSLQRGYDALKRRERRERRDLQREKEKERLVRDELQQLRKRKSSPSPSAKSVKTIIAAAVRKREYEEWSSKDTAEFIVQLNTKRYSAYSEILAQSLEFEGIDGSCLGELTKTDLVRLGIKQFKDRRDIFLQIQEFINSDSSSNDSMSNAEMCYDTSELVPFTGQ